MPGLPVAPAPRVALDRLHRRSEELVLHLLPFVFRSDAHAEHQIVCPGDVYQPDGFVQRLVEHARCGKALLAPVVYEGIRGVAVRVSEQDIESLLCVLGVVEEECCQAQIRRRTTQLHVPALVERSVVWEAGIDFLATRAPMASSGKRFQRLHAVRAHVDLGVSAG